VLLIIHILMFIRKLLPGSQDGRMLLRKVWLAYNVSCGGFRLVCVGGGGELRRRAGSFRVSLLPSCLQSHPHVACEELGLK